MLKAPQLECVCGGGGGLPGLAKQWKVLESILILRKSLSPTAGAVLVHNSCCARLGDPLSLPDLAFWVVLRESADGACVWTHRYIWLRGHLGTYDKLLGLRGLLVHPAPVTHEL